MRTRISLVHPSRHSVAPIERAFRTGWPEADIMSVIDDALYADVDSEGNMPANMPDRILALFRHCQASGASGIVFTGSTFGRAVDKVRGEVDVPVLKPDEAMAEHVAARGQAISLVCTAKRALPVIESNIVQAALRQNRQIAVRTHWVPNAQAEMAAGNPEKHNQLIAEVVESLPEEELVVLGQLSMEPALDLIAPPRRDNILTGSSATVNKMRALCEPDAFEEAGK